MKIQFKCKVCNLSPIDQIWPTSFYITKCVYTNEIQFKNKIDTIIVICELHLKNLIQRSIYWKNLITMLEKKHGKRNYKGKKCFNKKFKTE